MVDLTEKERNLVNITYGRGYLDGPRPKADEPSGMFAYRNKLGLNIIVCDSKNSVIRILTTSVNPRPEEDQRMSAYSQKQSGRDTSNSVNCELGSDYSVSGRNLPQS